VRLDLADDLPQRIVVGQRVAAVDRQLTNVMTGRKDRRARQGPNDDGSNLRRLGGVRRLGQVIGELDAKGVGGRAIEGDPGDLVGDLASNEGLFFFGDHEIVLLGVYAP